MILLRLLWHAAQLTKVEHQVGDVKPNWVEEPKPNLKDKNIWLPKLKLVIPNELKRNVKLKKLKNWKNEEILKTKNIYFKYCLILIIVNNFIGMANVILLKNMVIVKNHIFVMCVKIHFIVMPHTSVPKYKQKMVYKLLNILKHHFQQYMKIIVINTFFNILHYNKSMDTYMM